MMKPVILIVDDNPHITKSLTLNLEKEGFSVVHADNGETGLELVERAKPDLIISLGEGSPCEDLSGQGGQREARGPETGCPGRIAPRTEAALGNRPWGDSQSVDAPRHEDVTYTTAL